MWHKIKILFLQQIVRFSITSEDVLVGVLVVLWSEQVIIWTEDHNHCRPGFDSNKKCWPSDLLALFNAVNCQVNYKLSTWRRWCFCGTCVRAGNYLFWSHGFNSCFCVNDCMVNRWVWITVCESIDSQLIRPDSDSEWMGEWEWLSGWIDDFEKECTHSTVIHSLSQSFKIIVWENGSLH